MTSGDLSIAAGESTILYILPKPVRLFSEQYPAIKLRLANETGRDGMELLRSDKVDFAVGSMLEVPDDLIYDPIVTYNPVVITPLDHPLARLAKLTLKDIGQYGLILPPRHLSTWHTTLVSSLSVRTRRHLVSCTTCSAIPTPCTCTSETTAPPASSR